MEIGNSTSKDILKNIPALVILTFGFMPGMLNGYTVYALIAMLPLMWTYGFFRMTENALICLAFGLLFGGAYTVHCDLPLSSMVMYTLFPFIAYEAGLFMFKRFSSVNSLVLLLAYLAFILGAYAYYMCIKDYLETGNIINALRTIGVDEEVWDPDTEAEGINATGFGLIVSVILCISGMVMVKSDNKTNTVIKLICLAGGLLGFYVTVHLLNRTGLLLIALSFMVAVFRPPVSYVKLGVTLASVIILAGVLMVAVNSNAIVQKAVAEYGDRNDTVGYGIDSAGGRTDRWAAALEQIPTIPFGTNELDFAGEARYAHNLWLDSAVNGGWIPMILLIFLTARFIAALWKVVRAKNISSFNRTFFLLFGFGLLLQAFVEPVLQGSLPYFCLMLFFFAIVTCISKSDIMITEENGKE